jgi:hypothetical protein
VPYLFFDRHVGAHLQAKEMEEVNNKLQQRLASVEIKHTAMVNEVQTLDSNLKAKSAENEVLHAQVQKLRRSFTVRPQLSNTYQQGLKSQGGHVDGPPLYRTIDV